MGWFSRDKSCADPTEPCSTTPCSSRFQKRLQLIAKARDTIRYQKEHGGDAKQLADAQAAVTRFARDNEAMVRARSAENVYDPSKKGECLINLSRNPDKLNRELHLNPGLTKEDFENPESGFQATLYKSESNGRYVLAFKGTDPNSLRDWETNIDNGLGEDTSQYKAARNLARRLRSYGTDFDITGHSKGGGMATEAGMWAPGTNVWTFNSAGLSPASLGRTGAKDFSDITNRTQAFHTDGDFLTTLQDETDPAKQIASADELRQRLAGEESFPSTHPLNITKIGGDEKDESQLPELKKEFLAKLDKIIADAKAEQQQGKPVQLFPKAVGTRYTTGAPDQASGLRALIRHTMGGKGWVNGVIGDLEAEKKSDSDKLNSFIVKSGSEKVQIE